MERLSEGDFCLGFTAVRDPTGLGDGDLGRRYSADGDLTPPELGGVWDPFALGETDLERWRWR